MEKDNWELVEDFKNQIDEQKIKLLNNTDLVSRKTDKQKAKYERSSYHPLSTLSPRYLIPHVSLVSTAEDDFEFEIGLQTGGIDALENHQYQFVFFYDHIYPAPQVSFDYIYRNDFFDFITHFYLINRYRQPRNSTNNNDFINKRNLGVNMIFPLVSDFFAMTYLVFGANYDAKSGVSQPVILFNTDLIHQFIRGQNQFTYNSLINVGLEYEIDFSQPKSAGENWGVNLNWVNNFSIRDKHAFIADFYLGYNLIEDYFPGNLQYIRARASDIKGNNLTVLSLEYSRELFEIKTGIRHLPIFFDSLNIYPFYDLALIANESEIKTDSVYGLELGLKVDQFYGRETVEYKLGYNSKNEVYFKFGQSF